MSNDEYNIIMITMSIFFLELYVSFSNNQESYIKEDEQNEQNEK